MARHIHHEPHRTGTGSLRPAAAPAHEHSHAPDEHAAPHAGNVHATRPVQRDANRTTGGLGRLHDVGKQELPALEHPRGLAQDEARLRAEAGEVKKDEKAIAEQKALLEVYAQFGDRHGVARAEEHLTKDEHRLRKDEHEARVDERKIDHDRARRKHDTIKLDRAEVRRDRAEVRDEAKDVRKDERHVSNDARQVGKDEHRLGEDRALLKVFEQFGDKQDAAREKRAIAHEEHRLRHDVGRERADERQLDAARHTLRKDEGRLAADERKLRRDEGLGGKHPVDPFIDPKLRAAERQFEAKVKAGLADVDHQLRAARTELGEGKITRAQFEALTTQLESMAGALRALEHAPRGLQDLLRANEKPVLSALQQLGNLATAVEQGRIAQAQFAPLLTEYRDILRNPALDPEGTGTITNPAIIAQVNTVGGVAQVKAEIQGEEATLTNLIREGRINPGRFESNLRRLQQDGRLIDRALEAAERFDARNVGDAVNTAHAYAFGELQQLVVQLRRGEVSGTQFEARLRQIERTLGESAAPEPRKA